MSPTFHLHLTPDYSRVKLAGGKNPYKVSAGHRFGPLNLRPPYDWSASPST